MVFAKLTIGDYRSDFCIKAVRHAIREGHPRLAAFFSLELIETGYQEEKLLFLEMDKILYDDIGIADKESFLFIDKCLSRTKELLSHGDIKKEFLLDWRKPFFTAILALCETKRTKLTDYFTQTLLAARHSGWKPKIPDYVFDFTTQQGRSKGRDIEYLLETETDPDSFYSLLIDCGYLQMMKLIKEFETQNKIDFSIHPGKLNDDLILMKALFKEEWEKIKNFGEEQ